MTRIRESVFWTDGLRDSIKRCVRCCDPKPTHHVERLGTPGQANGTFLERPIPARLVWLCGPCLRVYERIGLVGREAPRTWGKAA